jgi:hypothetical protein
MTGKGDGMDRGMHSVSPYSYEFPTKTKVLPDNVPFAYGVFFPTHRHRHQHTALSLDFDHVSSMSSSRGKLTV